MKKPTRRHMLRAALFGAGGIGLKSLASGIPLSMLMEPTKAHAQEALTSKVLIMSNSGAGDPLNANVPGTYEDSRIQHSRDPLMAASPLSLGSFGTTAARPWAELPQSVLDRAAFIHHGTYTNAHPNHVKVMRLMGSTERNEMLVSLFAKELAGPLATVQQEPISVGARSAGELISFQGRTLSNVSPRALAAALAPGDNPNLADLRPLRDQAVDELYQLYKDHGTENQIRLLDRFVISREEAQSISTDLVDRLTDISGNDVADQIKAATILAAMNISPVITLHMKFGGDNHTDNEFAKETEEQVENIPLIGSMMESLDGMRAEGVLRHEVMFANLNVFGRDLMRKGRRGRDHNGRHHCCVVIGSAMQPGVYGGLRDKGDDMEAAAIDSSTGRASPSGDIPHEETFQTMAKTLGVALGVDRARLDEAIEGGQVLEPALAG